MAYGQPFYTYPNGGYTPIQNQTYNLYQPQTQMPTMPQNQAINGFQAQQQVPQAQQQVIPTKTNVPLVTSLTEAMSRTTELNSDTFYADQDNPFIYRVSVDMQGRKSYRTFELKDVTEQVVENSGQSSTQIDLSAYATKEDLQAFRNEIMGYAQSFGLTTTATQYTKSKKTEKTPIKSEIEDEIKE